jgi:serine phosphatase RsbU (regulator of sigma subunit)
VSDAVAGAGLVRETRRGGSHDGGRSVLIVEDDPAMRRATERVLGSFCETSSAESVQGALALALKRRFAIALVDIQLPDGDGYALCQEIRRISPETDVILMTGSLSGPDEKLYRSLEEGAFYFLFKPFEQRVLRALVTRALDLQRERRAKEKYASELADDLERARRFQRSLMPTGALREAGWHLEGRFLPCQALGGDFYLAIPNRDGSLAFALSDIVGHGVAAALVAGMLRSALEQARRRDPAPAAVLGELASSLDSLEEGSYATLVYGQLQGDGRLAFFNAGHPPLLLLHRGKPARELPATGLFLSPLLPRTGDEVESITLGPGDRLLVYSDGAFEVRDPTDRELGRPRLAAVLEETRSLPAPAALDALLRAVHEHAAGRPLGDDTTLLLVDRLEAASPGTRGRNADG